eukprot:TRINITY_DN2694_c0_g1_i1.p1 TRINITY_DN2694_c0_g1~~TRINITY_DN2694_c0_g1_i1.p1  ORF type:complete len:578 (-),score=68.16 TRINITY_DN2694_c0_g1_i1:353-1921(-)
MDGTLRLSVREDDDKITLQTLQIPEIQDAKTLGVGYDPLQQEYFLTRDGKFIRYFGPVSDWGSDLYSIFHPPSQKKFGEKPFEFDLTTLHSIRRLRWVGPLLYSDLEMNVAQDVSGAQARTMDNAIAQSALAHSRGRKIPTTSARRTSPCAAPSDKTGIQVYGRMIAVIIAVSNYPAGPLRDKPLPASVCDAAKVAYQLKQLGYDVRMLLDSEATHSNIKRLVAEVAEELRLVREGAIIGEVVHDQNAPFDFECTLTRDSVHGNLFTTDPSDPEAFVRVIKGCDELEEDVRYRLRVVARPKQDHSHLKTAALFYFAGHGHLSDTKVSYFCAHDFSMRFKADWMQIETKTKEFSQLCGAYHTLWFWDCCYSGGALATLWSPEAVQSRAHQSTVLSPKAQSIRFRGRGELEKLIEESFAEGCVYCIVACEQSEMAAEFGSGEPTSYATSLFLKALTQCCADEDYRKVGAFDISMLEMAMQARANEKVKELTTLGYFQRIGVKKPEWCAASGRFLFPIPPTIAQF